MTAGPSTGVVVVVVAMGMALKMAMMVVGLVVIVVLVGVVGNGAVCATRPLRYPDLYNSRTLHSCCWHS